MEDSHKLALYVSYYLSRFNDQALLNLGYSTWNNAFDDIADKLKVNRHSVKNWRDEFDPLFEHRAGWHQRPMIPSRIRVVQALENLDEFQIREIVQDIISGNIQNDREELEQLLNVVITDDNKNSTSKFVVRAPTGRAAEEYFIKYFLENKKPIDGNLIDCRDLGVGYDFRIESGDKINFIEVKGLSAFSGGVLFTHKEWTVAQKENDYYFLCVVSNINENPQVIFIQNPGNKFNAKRNIYTSIQISWSISENQLVLFK
jgi:hypothetical protein